MPLTWNEQYFDYGVTDSSSGVGVVRGWKVPLSTPEIAAADAGAPKFGDQHPDFNTNGLVINNVSFLPEGRHTVVRASYVPPEYQDPIPPEKTDGLDFFKIDTTFKDVTVNIPVFNSFIKNFSRPDGSLVAKFHWVESERKTAFMYAQTVHRVTLNATIVGGEGVTTQLNIAQEIHNQTNKLHTIGGVQYVFKADNIKRVKEDQYQFTYRWTYDQGIPNTLDFSSNPNSTATLGRYGGTAYPHADKAEFPHPLDGIDPNIDGYIIPPYHRMDVGLATQSSIDPVVKIRPQYISDPLGWRNLPGVL